MNDKNQDMLEQNKRINELTRKVGRLDQDVNTLKNAIEPDGWISQAFDQVEEHLTEHDRRFDQLERKIDHNFAELRSSLNHIIDHLTKLSDLPEE